MKVKDYNCKDCNHEYEDIILESCNPQCPECGSLNVKQLPNSFGGYKISGSNSASTRPKMAGYRSKK